MDYSKAVAVVGFGCKYPGANSPDELWRVLVNRENHVREVPKERWNNDFFYSADKQMPGKTYCKTAGLIDEPFLWDNTFFGINQIEAETMDPQHKLALETSYRALENAGIPLKKIKGTNTAVYMGGMLHDYNHLASVNMEFIESHHAAGTAISPLANRLSYFYDIHGPSMAVDSACSSGMMCIQLGSNHILSGEGDMAICGGAGFFLAPVTHIKISRSRMISAFGQCQAFSTNADGYARSEGCGVVILKNLQKAQADGDRIHCILTCGANSDGGVRSPMTNPSGEMQGKLMQKVLDRAKLQADQLQFVELHGTGTRVGDRAEVSGIGSVLAGKRTTPCPIGSMKTNIGHTEAASAFAGIMKLCLMMKHETMVPSIIFGDLKQSLNFEQNGVYVLQEVREWLSEVINGREVRVAALNCFGFAGSNGHAILEVPVEITDAKPKQVSIPSTTVPQVVLFSGTDAKSTRMSMEDTLQFLSTNQEQISLESIAYTSCFRRTIFKHRVGLPVTGMADLQAKLKSILANKSEIGHSLPEQNTNTIFVFSGMGTVWEDMGKALYGTEPAYKETIDNLQIIFSDISAEKYDLKQILQSKSDLLKSEFGQPAIFACQVALFHLWKAKGVVPNVVLGHSLGEIAAAYASGYLSLDSAAYLIYHRAQAVSKAQPGAMLAIGKLPIQHVQDVLDQFNGKVVIAAYNSPISCTVSGPSDDIDQLMTHLECLEPEPFLRKLKVDAAFHSQYMDSVLPGFKAAIRQKSLTEAQTDLRIPFISTSTDNTLDGKELITPEYWVRNLRNSVQFSDALAKAVVSDKTNVIIEVGPKPVLKTNISQTEKQVTCEYLPSLGENKTFTFYRSLAKAFEFGLVQENACKTTGSLTLCPIPRYGFNKQYLYKIPEEAKQFLQGKQSIMDKSTAADHVFVRRMSPGEGDPENVFQAEISPTMTPFVYAHKVQESIVVPGATYVEMVHAAFMQMDESKSLDSSKELSVQVWFHEPIRVPTGSSKINTKITLQQEDAKHDQFYFDITVDTTLHATGRLRKSDSPLVNEPRWMNIDQKRRDLNQEISGDAFYQSMQHDGFKYADSVRYVVGVNKNNNVALVEMRVPQDVAMKDVASMHPAILDALIYSGSVFKTEIADSSIQVIPVGINDIRIYGKATNHMFASLKLSNISDSYMETEVALCDANGRVLAECKGIRIGFVGKYSHFDADDVHFLTSWKEIQPQKPPQTPKSDRKWLVITDQETSFPLDSIQNEMQVVYLDRETINKIMDDPSNFTDVMPPDLMPFSAIIYLVGLHRDKDVDQITGDEMSEFVLRTNMVLIQFIKGLNKRDTKPPLYVLTKQVYALLQCNEIGKHDAHSLDSLSALLGNTVTAMCRTIYKELPMFPLHTVDLSAFDEPSFSLLCSHIADERDLTDVVIHEGRIMHRVHLNIAHMNIGQSRLVAVGDNDNVVLRQNNEGRVFLEPTHVASTKQLSKQPEKRTCKLKSVLMHTITMRQTFDDTLCSYDSLCTNESGDMVHICKYQTITRVVQPDDTFILPFKDFPCQIPSLSYWMLAWNMLKKIDAVGETPLNKAIRLVIAGCSPIWEPVVRSLVQLLGIQITQEASSVLVIVSEISDGLNQNSIVDGEKLFVISENYSKHLAPESINGVQRIETLAALQSHSYTQDLIASFKVWLRKKGSSAVQPVIAEFEKDMKDTCATANISDLSDGLKVSATKPVIVNFDSPKPDSPAIQALAKSPKHLIKNNGGYIVIGGRKGLGLETIKYLIRNGAKYIGVISRSVPNEENKQKTADIEKQYGCQVIDFQADTSNMTELQSAFEAFAKATHVQIKGIFYGAAVLADGMVLEMTKENFQKVLPSKVAGVWNVYKLAHDLQLDLFVMYSSMTSMDGHRGQSNYGAGNGFKDAVACMYRQTRGVGQSICFAYLDTGMSTRDSLIGSKVTAAGAQPITKAEIVECLNYGLIENKPIVGYAKTLWPRHMFHSRHMYMYDQLLKRHFHFRKRREDLEDQTLASSANKDTHDYINDVIRQIMLTSESTVDSNATLAEIGADSQDQQMIHTVFARHLGFSESDMSLQDMGRMTLNELAVRIDALKMRSSKDS